MTEQAPPPSRPPPPAGSTPQPHGRRRRRGGRGGNADAGPGAQAGAPRSPQAQQARDGQARGPQQPRPQGAPRQGQPGQGPPRDGRRRDGQPQRDGQQRGGAPREGQGPRHADGGAPGKGPRPEAPRRDAVPRVSSIVAAEVAAETPLTPAEVAEMKQHLQYLRSFKAVLRLTLNATEDLVVNGQREPTDRGACRHLLAKVDRAAVEAALAREPVRSNPAERARLLAGAVRLTGDVGVLLLWLENLVEGRAREEAASALESIVATLDFSSVSAARLARLLELMGQVFGPQQRFVAVLGLVARPAFKAAVDAAGDRLPEEVRDMLAPARALQQRADDPRSPLDSVLLTRAIAAAADLAPGMLPSLAEGLRRSLVEAALDVTDLPVSSTRVVDALLPTLPAALQARLATRHASRALGRGDDARARALLSMATSAQPQDKQPARWLAALDAPRLGEVALVQGPASGNVRTGWLPATQRDVWLARHVSVDAATSAAALMRACTVPGVAVVVAHGGKGSEGYVASVGPGQPLGQGNMPRHPEAALLFLASAARALHGVALAGVQVADAGPSRWLVEGGRVPQATLVDVAGAQQANPAEAGRANLAAWPALRDAILVPDLKARLDTRHRAALASAEAATTLPALVSALEGVLSAAE